MNAHTLPRPLTPVHKRSFLDLWRRIRILDVAPSELIDARDAPNNRTYIAVAARWKDDFLGGAVLEIAGDTAIVHRLHVDPAWRRHGVGVRLMEGLLQRARLQLVTDVYVAATAAEAGFFALRGFRPVEQQDGGQAFARLLCMDEPGAVATGASYVLMHRHLTSAFVNVHYDRGTVKL